MNRAVEMTEPRRTLEDEVLEHHRLQLELCDRLERLADSLPDQYDPQECLSISWQIYSTVKSAHKFEEEMLFPRLLEPGLPGKEIQKRLIVTTIEECKRGVIDEHKGERVDK